MYHIYYLPYVVREHLPGIVGKVGMSSKDPEIRKQGNIEQGLDVTGHRLLESGIELKYDALRLEYEYQCKFNCVDNTKSPIYRENMSRVKKGT